MKKAIPINSLATGAAQPWVRRVREQLVKNRFDAHRRARFFLKMIQFVKAGRPLDESFAIVHRRYVTEDDSLRLMTEDWQAKARKTGFSMQVAKGWIPDDELGLIMAGERVENVVAGFEAARDMALTRKKLEDTLAKEMREPKFYVLMMVGVLLAFVYGLAPVMQEILEVSAWPLIARSAYYFGTAVSVALLPALALWIALGYLIRQNLPLWTGESRQALDRLPPWSIYKTMQACGFLLALSGMMRQGRPLDSAIKEYDRTASPYVRSFISQMLARKRLGRDEAESMAVGFFDAETEGDLMDMGKGGGASLQAAMHTLGSSAQDSAIETVSRIATRLKRGALLLVGLMVVWVYSSFILTNFEAAKVAKNQTTAVGR